MDTPPSMILQASALRRQRERRNNIDLALATSDMILRGIAGKPDTLASVKHMLTDAEYDALLEEREEAQTRLAEEQMFTKLMRMRK